MEKDKATFLLKADIAEALKRTFPSLEVRDYRDGGSIAFDIPAKPYRNIVLVAPVQRVTDGIISRIYINSVQILKAGCTKFEDIYKKENIVKVILLDDNSRDFDEERVKKEIIDTLNKEIVVRMTADHVTDVVHGQVLTDMAKDIYKKTLAYELDKTVPTGDGKVLHLHSDKFLDEHPERRNRPEFTEKEEMGQIKAIADTARTLTDNESKY